MGKLSEIPFGNRYGKLVVLSEEPHLKRNDGRMKRMVKVECDCGQVVVKSWNDVRSNQQKSCGLCPKEMKVEDHSGKRLGRLTVTNNFIRTDRGIRWECNCDCTNTRWVDARQIVEERVYNCGKCGTLYGTYYWGDIIVNREGTDCEILSIENNIVTLKDVKSGGVFTCAYTNLKNGCFSNPFYPSVAGVGYFGVGKFCAKGQGEDRHTVEYEDWNSMMKRCYVRNNGNVSYADKTVEESWHNFQVFAEWATNQPNFGRKGWQLDKDLLVKGSTLYSENTCVYLPSEINSFIKRRRFNDLPLGVDIAYEYNGTAYFRVQAREDGKNIVLGKSYDVVEAFNMYKVHKEGLAKDLANKWKNDLPENAIEALMNYTVDIND